MTNNNACPECGKIYSTKFKKCNCGWSDPDREAVSDYGCQYRVNARRCPLPGSMSTSLYGLGTWYCSDHWFSLGNSQLGEAILLNAEKNYQTIIQNRRDWRRNLLR